MTTLNTITTIELSNLCNLECKYCINRLFEKEKGIMSDTVFEWSLLLLITLCDKGTQKEVNLNGNGESFLDPDLVDRVKAVKEVVGNREVALCTNAVYGFDMAKIMALKEAGLDRLDLSVHNTFATRKALDIIKQAQMPCFVNFGAVTQSHNWAGQLEPENCVKVLPNIRCDPLIEGRGYIQRDGGITPCCYDYRDLGKYGTVFDKDILEKEIKPFKLCKACHQQIPNEILLK